MNKGEVYFSLWGDFDPSTLSLGIEPTRIHEVRNHYPKQAAWIFSSGQFTDTYIDVYQMTSDLVNELKPHIEKIIKAKQDLVLEAVLEVVLTISSDEQFPTPAIGFDRDVISFLSDVGATIDIDTYRR